MVVPLYKGKGVMVVRGHSERELNLYPPRWATNRKILNYQYVNMIFRYVKINI